VSHPSFPPAPSTPPAPPASPKAQPTGPVDGAPVTAPVIPAWSAPIPTGLAPIPSTSASIPTERAPIPPGAPVNGGSADPEALTHALDAALDELDRNAEQTGPIELSPAELAEDAAAAAGDRAAQEAVSRRQRRAGLRTVVSTMSGKVMAERTARATEAAVAAVAAAEAARGEPAAQAPGSGSERSVAHPFRTGFLVGLGLILAYVTYLTLDTIKGTLIVIAVAALLAIGLDPAVGWLMRRHLRRGLAVTTVFLGLLAVLAGAVYAIVPPIVSELVAFITSVPNLIANLRQNPTILNLDQKFHILSALQNSDFVQKLGNGAAGSILSAGVTVAGIGADLFIVLILTLFFLAGFPKIKRAGYRLAPASRRMRVTDLGDKILKQMGGYLGGATLVAMQAGLVAGVFAAIVGLPYPWAIALGAALFDFIPVVGPIIVGLSMCLLGFTQSVTIGIVAAAFYVCQHLFEAYWLYPRVMRRQVDISTGAVVVAILLGGALLGVTGALLAVPVAAAVQLIVREVLMPRQERH